MRGGGVGATTLGPLREHKAVRGGASGTPPPPPVFEQQLSLLRGITGPEESSQGGCPVFIWSEF